ncbi:MAG: RidA family protein [Anaerolineales bacterium]|nr:RidA family protein [Anaerolineales bacterium]
MAERKILSAENTPKAIGPYSPAVLSGDLFFSSGQLGLDPATGERIPGGVAAETRQALSHCARLLEAAGGSMRDVLKTTVFLRDMADFARMNAVYAEFFPQDPPARTTVQVAALPKGADVEIECLARIPPKRESSRRRK